MPGEVIRMVRGPGRVVVGFRLSRPAVEHLQAQLGRETVLVDIRDSDGRERLVLAPPASPQLLGQLHQAFPDARIMVVELTDLEAGVRLGGPVTRAVDAGADGYVVARSLGQLAEIVSRAVAAPLDVRVPAEIAPPAEEDLAALVEEVIARRAERRRVTETGSD